MTSIDPSIYQILVVKQGLKAVKEGFRVNRAYTPKNLKHVTEAITGRKFKARDYDSMILALEEKLDELRTADS